MCDCWGRSPCCALIHTRNKQLRQVTSKAHSARPPSNSPPRNHSGRHARDGCMAHLCENTNTVTSIWAACGNSGFITAAGRHEQQMHDHRYITHTACPPTSQPVSPSPPPFRPYLCSDVVSLLDELIGAYCEGDRGADGAAEVAVVPVWWTRSRQLCGCDGVGPLLGGGSVCEPRAGEESTTRSGLQQTQQEYLKAFHILTATCPSTPTNNRASTQQQPNRNKPPDHHTHN